MITAVDLETEVVDLATSLPSPVAIALARPGQPAEVHPWSPALARELLRAETVWFHSAFDLAVIAAELGRAPVAEAVRAGRVHDVQLLDILLRIGGAPGGIRPRSLADCARALLGVELEKGPVRLSFRRGEPLTDEQRRYAARDAEVTLRLFQLLPTLAARYGIPWQDRGWGILTERIQVGAALALGEIRRRGLPFRADLLPAELERLTRAESDALATLRDAGLVTPRGRIREKALRAHALSLHPDLPPTPSGRPSLARAELEHLDVTDPLLLAYLSYRRSQRWRVTFLETWARAGAVIHPYYLPIVATGRVSCRSPNLQQIPRELRHLFAAPGLVEFDYHALELFAVATCCPGRLGDLLRSGQDPHRFLAARIYGHDPDPHERQVGKMANFGFWGGLGPARFREHCFRLARLRLSDAQARAVREAWLDAFPEARDWLRSPPPPAAHRLGYDGPPRDVEQILAGRGPPELQRTPLASYVWRLLRTHPSRFRLDWPEARPLLRRVRLAQPSPTLAEYVLGNGVETLTGRYRFPVAYSAHLNTRFQGLAADGAKLALFELWAAGECVRAFVHDSFVVENPGPRVPDLLVSAMSQVLPNLPIRVEARPWGACQSDSPDPVPTPVTSDDTDTCNILPT